VRRITEELCGTSFSKSTVSRLCGQLDGVVQAWNNRDLSGQPCPFVIVDALMLKIRHDGPVHRMSALIAIGINSSGHREILGIRISNSESYTSWSELFVWLKRRGLQGVDLVVSDHHEGLVEAIQRHFQGAFMSSVVRLT